MLSSLIVLVSEVQMVSNSYEIDWLTANIQWYSCMRGEKKEDFFFLNGNQIGFSHSEDPRSKSHRSCSQKPLSLFSLALSEDLLPWDSFAAALITVNLLKRARHLRCPSQWRENCNHKVFHHWKCHSITSRGRTLDANIKSYGPKLTHFIVKMYLHWSVHVAPARGRTLCLCCVNYSSVTLLRPWGMLQEKYSS